MNIQAQQGAKAGSQNQDAVVRAMMDPSVYPKRPPEVTHKETHISHLFFAGELVYKIKKAVRYSFLDYSTASNSRIQIFRYRTGFP